MSGGKSGQIKDENIKLGKFTWNTTRDFYIVVSFRYQLRFSKILKCSNFPHFTQHRYSTQNNVALISETVKRIRIESNSTKNLMRLCVARWGSDNSCIIYVQVKVFLFG